MIKIDLRKKKDKEPRSDKKIRVNPSLDQDTHQKLEKLSISCEFSKTSMAAEIIRMAVNHPDIIDFYQKKYNKKDQYRVIPVQSDGKITY